MIDSKRILESSEKLIDNLNEDGYIWGKIEISYDSRTGVRKIELHQYDRRNNKTIRTTETIIKK